MQEEASRHIRFLDAEGEYEFIKDDELKNILERIKNAQNNKKDSKDNEKA